MGSQQIGTNLYKDKVVGSTDQDQQRGCPRVPTVVFPNWPEGYESRTLPVAMQQFPAQLTAGFQPPLDRAHVGKPSLSIACNPFQPPSSNFFPRGQAFLPRGQVLSPHNKWIDGYLDDWINGLVGKVHNVG